MSRFNKPIQHNTKRFPRRFGFSYITCTMYWGDVSRVIWLEYCYLGHLGSLNVLTSGLLWKSYRTALCAVTDNGLQTWVLDENITKDYQTLRQDTVDDGIGNSYAAIKFACHNAGDPNQKGVMRICIQTPIAKDFQVDLNHHYKICID